MGCVLLTGVRPYHVLLGSVALYSMEKPLPAAQHHFRPPAAPAAYSSTLLPAIGYQSSGWLPNGVPFLPEPASARDALAGPVASRLGERKCMRMRFSTASGAASPPSTAVNVPHKARVPQAAVDAFGHQVLRPPYSCNGVGPSYSLVGPMPLWCGGLHEPLP